MLGIVFADILVHPALRRDAPCGCPTLHFLFCSQRALTPLLGLFRWCIFFLFQIPCGNFYLDGKMQQRVLGTTGTVTCPTAVIFVALLLGWSDCVTVPLSRKDRGLSLCMISASTIGQCPIHSGTFVTWEQYINVIQIPPKSWGADN